MANQTYALAKNGVFGLSGGVYQDSLVTIIDDFEDADISEYTHDTSYWTVQSTTGVQNGSYAAECTASLNTNNVISSYSGLNYYPSQGDTTRVWARGNGMDYMYFWFGSQSGTGGSGTPPDGYSALLYFGQSSFRLRKRASGSNTDLASTSQSFSQDTDYEVEADWGSDGAITLTLFDSTGSQLAQLSATDTTFTSGGVSLQSDGGCFFDYARVI